MSSEGEAFRKALEENDGNDTFLTTVVLHCFEALQERALKEDIPFTKEISYATTYKGIERLYKGVKCGTPPKEKIFSILDKYTESIELYDDSIET